jgi:hypothetical protein
VIKYLNYQVVTIWNSEENDGKDADLFLEEDSTEDCYGCSKVAGNGAAIDFGKRIISPDSEIRINLKATPIYYKNFMNLDNFSGYKLQFMSLKKQGRVQASQSELTDRDLALF